MVYKIIVGVTKKQKMLIPKNNGNIDYTQLKETDTGNFENADMFTTKSTMCKITPVMPDRPKRTNR